MKREIVACLVWLAVGGLLSAGSLQLALGSVSSPGPGFLPLITGVLMILATIMQLVQLRIRSVESSTSLWGPEVRWGRGMTVVIGLILYAITVEYLGYLLGTFLLMLALFSLYDRKEWKFALLKSMLVIGVVYVVFGVWLKVQFPAGILEVLWR